MDSNLTKILDWAKIYAPQTLGYLNRPASDTEISTVERTLRIPLPDAFKNCLSIFNGENGPWLALLGNGNQLLSCAGILEQYRLDQDIATHINFPEMDTIAFWRDRIASHVIFVKGPVKPLMKHPKWVPITCMNGDVLRYLDFDPAPGGYPGQVIEVDPEGCSYQVLAESFEALLALYAQQLTDGLFQVDDEGFIESAEVADDMNWGMPEWLANLDT